MKTVKDSCNCCWKHCDHKNDVCPHEAIGFDCGNCEKIHWLGDQSLGNGFRLCVDCVGSIMTFMADDICKLMHDLSPFVPLTMQCIESVLKDHYLSFIQSEENKDDNPESWKSWNQPIRDSRALMEFAGLVLKSNGKKIPVEVLERSVEIAKKHRDLIEAFTDVGSMMEEEIK